MSEGTFSFSEQGGLTLPAAEFYAVGVVRRPTKNSTEDDPRYWQGVELATDPKGAKTLVFTDREVYERLYAMLREAGKPVQVTCSLRYDSAMNLDDAQPVAKSAARAA